MRTTLAFIVASLLACATARAQDTDDFERADELLQANAFWTHISAAGGDALVLANLHVETDGVESARHVYHGPAQASSDFYVETDILFLPTAGASAEALATRIVDSQNYIFLTRNQGGNCLAGIREASADTVWLSSSPALCDGATRMRIEAQGTAITFYMDAGAGMELYHTQNGVTTFQSSVLGGYASIGASGTDGLALWDNFEMDTLTTPSTGSALFRRR